MLPPPPPVIAAAQVSSESRDKYSALCDLPEGPQKSSSFTKKLLNEVRRKRLKGAGADKSDLLGSVFTGQFIFTSVVIFIILNYSTMPSTALLVCQGDSNAQGYDFISSRQK